MDIVKEFRRDAPGGAAIPSDMFEPTCHELGFFYEWMCGRIGITMRPSVDNPIWSHEALCSDAKAHGLLSRAVWTGGQEQQPFPHIKQNEAGRAWHDAVHLISGTDFSVPGEVATYNVQVALLRATWADFAEHRQYGSHGSAIIAAQRHCVSLLAAEVVGQRLYYEKWGRPPQAQAAFDYLWCVEGVAYALDTPYL